MNRPSICIKPHDFNESQLVIMTPHFYQPMNTNIKIKTSDILYKNDNDELCSLFITLPSDQTYGPSPIYNFNPNKTPETIQNYSITIIIISQLLKTCLDH